MNRSPSAVDVGHCCLECRRFFGRRQCQEQAAQHISSFTYRGPGSAHWQDHRGGCILGRSIAIGRPRANTLNIVYFTVVAVVLYLAADRILDRIEVTAGRRFQHRSIFFFAILLTLALISFSLIRAYTGNP